ncbi:unnamed protein product [Coregonus sp. 'balchen']|nr:unnamed protein product [Coregonus sp. 'balchen']
MFRNPEEGQNLKQYNFVTNKPSWTEAQSYCRERYTDLATVDNMEDIERVIELVEDTKDPIWIGLYDDGNSWRWSLEEFYGEGAAEFWTT